jgi:4-hydroxy-tetrahydrodipicolinate synthase
MLKFKGIIPAVLTPFNNKGEFDEEAQRENLRFLIENGVHGLMVNGSTGEAENLSREERRKNVELAVEEAGGKIPVIAGTGVPSTKATIDLSKDAKDAGADAVMIVTPFYLIPNEEGLIKHYKTITEKVDVPIVLYNIPQHTKVNLDSTLIEKLCNEAPNIVGLKDSYGNLSQFADTIARVGDKISVLTGCDDLILPSLILGAPGAIVALANIAPKMVVELFEYAKKGEINKAKEIYFKLLPIARAIGSEYNFPAPVKEAVNLLGRKAGPPRSPITQLSTKEKEEIKKALKHAGLIQ